jgi:hypothetical protein
MNTTNTKTYLKVIVDFVCIVNFVRRSWPVTAKRRRLYCKT